MPGKLANRIADRVLTGVRVYATLGCLIAAGALALLAAPVAPAASDATSESCANGALVGFASVLPDCRAYEMVTPAYQDGSAARWLEYRPPPISTDGEHILGLDLGGFAGTEEAEQDSPEQTGAIYEFSRAGSGWSTESLEPPAPLAVRSNFVSESADLSKTLWELPAGVVAGEETTSPKGYYYALREQTPSATARFVELGPSDSPSDPGVYNELRYGGASEELSHVIFTVSTEKPQTLWPGDTTEPGDPSLYEYVGTGNREPRLVAVRNRGPLDGSPHLNEGAELISKCGARPGSADSGYNDISKSGEKVFFTAYACTVDPGEPPENELYARVGGETTLDISEPSGEACEACDDGERTAATFEGASSDGSKVFFLSAQKDLLPGAEGQNLYEYDLDGPAHQKLTRIGSAVGEPKVLGVSRVSQDGSHVYFVAEGALAGANGEGKQPTERAPNLYDYDTVTGRTAFVATLSASDASDWSLADARPVQSTEDGEWLVFSSHREGLTSDDTSPEAVAQLFEYNAGSETLVRVSVGQSGDYYCASSKKIEAGYACDGNTAEEGLSPRILAPAEGSPHPGDRGIAIADDGAVFFSSFNALTPEASVEEAKTNPIERENVYEYEAGNVHLLSPPVEPAPFGSEQPHFLGADTTGEDAFFFTTASLVSEDVDTQASWYDVRAGGGFPAQAQAQPCEASACQGAPPSSPALPALGGSATAAGGENLAPVLAAAVKPPLTRARELQKALSACRSKRARKRRESCEASARARYGKQKPKQARKTSKAKPEGKVQR